MTERDITICGHGSGTPSLKNMYAYLQTRQSTSWNGTNKGLVEVRRFLTAEQATRFAGNYATLLGRNIYNQNLRTYVFVPYTNGKYYSDCSSSGDATYMQCGKNIGWINTEGMHYDGTNVDVRIKNGHIVEEDLGKLQVGDALLFRGNSSRVLNIGHVEFIYEIPKSTVIKTLPKGTVVYPDAYVSKDSALALLDDSYLTILVDGLAVRSAPDFGVRPYWYHIKDGYISAYKVEGWLHDEVGYWYERNDHQYYRETVAKINGRYFAFMPDGYMASHMDSDGAIY